MYIKLRNIFGAISSVAVIFLFLKIPETFSSMLISRFAIEAERAYQIGKIFRIVFLLIAAVCVIITVTLEMVSQKSIMKAGKYRLLYYSYENMKRACEAKLVRKKYSLYECIQLDSYSEIAVYSKRTKRNEVTSVAIFRAYELTEEVLEQFEEKNAIIQSRCRNENRSKGLNSTNFNTINIYCVDLSSPIFEKLAIAPPAQSGTINVRLRAGISFNERTVYVSKLQNSEANKTIYPRYERAYAELCQILCLDRGMLIESGDQK